MRIQAGTCSRSESVSTDGAKRSGLRTLLAFRVGERAFFVFGFAKNERANVSGPT